MRPSRQVLITVALAALVVIAFIVGAISQRDPLFSPAHDELGFVDTGGRTKIGCATLTAPNTAVLLTLGQSNAGNHGEAPFVPTEAVFNFDPADGACYTAREPLLGATGSGSSPWTRLGDRLIAASLYDKVVIVPIAIGGSSVTDWASGDGHTRLVSAVRGVVSAGLSISHVLWHQGETDAINGMSGETYARHLTAVLRSVRTLGVSAPIYIAQASLCMDSPRNDDIREGQRAVVTRLEGIIAGPDTDTLTGPDMRYDGCHFTAQGLDAHAELWFEAMTKADDR